MSFKGLLHFHMDFSDIQEAKSFVSCGNQGEIMVDLREIPLWQTTKGKNNIVKQQMVILGFQDTAKTSVEN